MLALPTLFLRVNELSIAAFKDMLKFMDSPETDRYHHGNLREALIDQAEKDLETQGIAQLSLRALARKLGVSKNAPYRHIKDKQELVQLLIERGYEHLYQFMIEEIEKEPESPKVQSIGKGYVRFGLAHPQLYKVMFHEQKASDCPAEDRNWFSGNRAFKLLGQMTDQQSGESGTPMDAFASWAYVHGIVSFLIDGLVDPKYFMPQGTTMEQFIEGLFRKDYLNG